MTETTRLDTGIAPILSSGMTGGTLVDNADIVMGQSPPGETCSATGRGLPLLNGPTEYGPHHPTPAQFTTEARKRARPGDILFCVRGSTTGRMNWADREYAIGRGVAAIRHKNRPELQPFVRAVIEYDLPGLLAQATGSTFPNVSADQLAGLWWPPIEEDEQRAIAQILGTLDDKIELNRRTSETLEGIAGAIFKSWFVDFDPVRAKMEGAQLIGMSPETAALFPDALVDSQLGLIPEGWLVAPLAKFADEIREGVRPEQMEEGLTYIGLEHMPRKSIALGGWDLAMGLASNKWRFSRGDILFGKLRPYFHKVGIAPIDGVCSTDIIVVRARSDSFSFVLEHLSSNELVANADSTSTGTRMPRTNWGDLGRWLVAEPPLPLLKRFEGLAGPLLGRIPLNTHENRVLAQLRDTLLPKLISGEIRVKEAS